MMGSVTFELNETIAAGWRRGLKGADEHEDGQDRAHWRTKVSYYRAMEDHLALAPSPPLTWDAIVSMVRPRGSRTTFYDVIGTKAAHPPCARSKICWSLEHSAARPRTRPKCSPT